MVCWLVAAPAAWANKPINLAQILADPRVNLGVKCKLYYKTARNPVYENPWRWDSWQLDDLRTVIDPKIKEVMLLRNRGGSKTRDAACMAVFFGYLKNKRKDWNRILWYAGSDKQLDQVYVYFRENRYVKDVTGDEVRLWNGNVIGIRLMSEKQAVGPRSDIIFFDEEQSMKMEWYRMAIGTQVGGDHKKIHMGTTEMDTVLEMNYHELSPEGMVLEHHIDECSWTDEEEELKNYRGMPQFVIDSQLYCKWVRAGGQVFEDVEERELTIEEWQRMEQGKFGGIDPNPKSGHAYVDVRYVHAAPNCKPIIYVTKEIDSHILLEEWNRMHPDQPKDDSELFAEFVVSQLCDDIQIEIEENNGEEFIKTLERMGVEVLRDQWNRWGGKAWVQHWDEKLKKARIYTIRMFKIVVSPDCKAAAAQIRSAVWNPKDPTASVLKTPTMHYFDAFVHAPQKHAETTAKMIPIPAY